MYYLWRPTCIFAILCIIKLRATKCLPNVFLSFKVVRHAITDPIHTHITTLFRNCEHCAASYPMLNKILHSIHGIRYTPHYSRVQVHSNFNFVLFTKTAPVYARLSKSFEPRVSHWTCQKSESALITMSVILQISGTRMSLTECFSRNKK